MSEGPLWGFRWVIRSDEVGTRSRSQRERTIPTSFCRNYQNNIERHPALPDFRRFLFQKEIDNIACPFVSQLCTESAARGGEIELCDRFRKDFFCYFFALRIPQVRNPKGRDFLGEKVTQQSQRKSPACHRAATLLWYYHGFRTSCVVVVECLPASGGVHDNRKILSNHKLWRNHLLGIARGNRKSHLKS